MDAANEHPAPDRWAQVEIIFLEALALPVDDRAAFLDAACAGDDEAAVRKAVDALLAAHEEAGDDYLDALDPDGAAALLQETDAAVSGPIGPYRIVHEVGRGGMGTVYLAERGDGQFEQQVALKLIKRGMDSEAVLRRFRTERQILARLHHPGIARLYDGGVSDDGRPYFAMEYVEGQPITRYCDDHRLSIERRLRLFEGVCEAVHYAHRNLVVHRDLKPSNILVAEPVFASQDRRTPKTEDGQVKLLDFGIGKVLSDASEQQAQTVTEAGLRVMTPEYAAPEQVRGEPVTTATDVYALGVVLYELLTGRRPYDVDGRTPEAVARVVCDTEPDRPSTVVSRIQEGETEMTTTTSEIVEQRRATSPAALRRRLAGDLDTVVLKALRKEPERRYASAEAFVEDIKRHLAGLPVAARSATVGYRIRKFIGRHKAGVTGVLLVLFALIVGMGLAVWQAQVAADQRDLARREAQKAEQVAGFMIEVFKAADPYSTPSDTITARELLRQGVDRIEERLAGQPAMQAQLMDVLGEVHQHLGSYDEAEALYQRALALRRSVHDNLHPDVATSLSHLATIIGAKGNVAAADSMHQVALAMRRSLYDEVHPDIASSLTSLGILSIQQLDYRRADSLLREALTIRREVFGPEHPRVAESLSNLGRVYHNTGDVEETERLYRDALAIRQKQLGREHPETLSNLNDLAVLLYQQEQFEAAEPFYREAVAIGRTVLGSDHAVVATYLSNLATLLYNKQQYSEARSLHEEALAARRKAYGEDHWMTATSQQLLGRTLHQLGELDEAEDALRQALAVYRANLPVQHNGIASVATALGELLLDSDRPAEALPLLKEGLDIRQIRYPEGHRRIGYAKSAYGAGLLALARYAEAEPFLQEGYAIMEREYRAGNWFTERARQRLRRLYTAWGKPDEADAHRALLGGSMHRTQQ
ncbi:MAG: tetratricopeptide repeat protein [Bacteroidetes bacterium]|jgi:serine/threonine-protein kinase|nr:tetratricopeptide repeat protein [Bacteroidota bacterium]